MRYNYLFSFLFTLLLSACGSSYQAPVDEAGGGPLYLDSGRTHLVNAGETLYVIAWMYDLDFSALARANNLPEPYAVTAAPQVAARTATVTTNPVQTAAVIQRAPLPGSGITRRELPPARSTAPVAEPPLTSTTPVSVPGDALPPSPLPVAPPVTTIEQPQSNIPTELPPGQTVPQVQATPPVVATPPPAPVPAVIPPSRNTPPVPAVASEQNVNWAWPYRGAIVGHFSDGGVENKGLDLSGNKGDPILAAAAGEVVYSGSGLLRYGDLIIIKHNEHFLSAYAHNSALLVKEGDKVTRGQKIAELGSSGIDRNMLHFEIRLDGKPVDPQLYLPVL
jgi:lipoprotein NlpD